MSQTSATSSNAERALEILLLLGDIGPEGLSLAQISERIGVGKSAVHRSLVALMHKGFAEAAPRYGHYRVGPAVAMIARRQERLEPQIELIRPGMTEFARHTGFTVYLMVQAGVDAVCAEMVSRSTREHFKMGLGARVPMGIAAGSVALLSMLPPASAEAVMRANAERYRSYPALHSVDVSVISSQVEAARQAGYSVNMGYYLPGVGGLGLPLPARRSHDVNFAVSFNAPVEMMTQSWIAETIEVLRGCMSDVLGPLDAS